MIIVGLAAVDEDGGLTAMDVPVTDATLQAIRTLTTKSPEPYSFAREFELLAAGTAPRSWTRRLEAIAGGGRATAGELRELRDAQAAIANDGDENANE